MGSKSTAAQAVEAAGGVIVRQHADVLEVLLAHRPRYDDWTFPKGKLEPGETLQQCALREVLEETGLRCTIGAELPSTVYHDRHGRTKTVHYWVMQVDGGAFTRNREVDDVCWVVPDEAARRLTYPRDLEVLKSVGLGR